MDRKQEGHRREPRESPDDQETGAGAEAAEGIHSVGGRPVEDRSAVDRALASDDPGSEPLRDRQDNPKGSYGGDGGRPRRPPEP